MDIAEIVQDAKEHILKEGEHRPMLYIEFEEKEVNLVAFADFPYKTTLEKQKAFFAIGRKLGEESPGKEIRQIIFIVEAWASSYKAGEPRPDVSPSKDPNRKEVLMINVLDADTSTRELKLSTHLVEMLRDGSGALVDLLHHRSEQLEVTGSPLLTSMLAGFLSTKLSERELARIVRKALRKSRE